MRYAAPLFAMTLFLVACGGGGPGGTPQETFEAMKSAVKGEDWGTVYEIIAPARRKKMEEELKGQVDEVAGMLEKSADDVKSMSTKDVFVAVMEKMSSMGQNEMAEAAESEFVKEEIEGDSAKVTFKQGDSERSVRMVKVDGKWYVDEGAGM